MACCFSKLVRSGVFSSLGLGINWGECTLRGFMEQWIDADHRPVHIPLLYFWSIWKERNCYIFNGFRLEVQKVVVDILGLLKDFTNVSRVSRCRMIDIGSMVEMQ